MENNPLKPEDQEKMAAALALNYPNEKTKRFRKSKTQIMTEIAEILQQVIKS